jgi:hypothetical protein
MDRPLSNLRKRFRKARKETSPIHAYDGFSALDVIGDSGWAGLALGLAVLLLIVIFLPLLGVALELIVVLLIFSSGIVGRVVFGRPWTVEAINLDDDKRSIAFGVKGFRKAGRGVEELATILAAGGPPDRLSEGSPDVARQGRREPE